VAISSAPSVTVRVDRASDRQQSTAKRRQIHQARVQPEDGRGQRHRRQRVAIGVFEQGAKPAKARDVLDVARQQQLLGHIEHEQGCMP